VSELQIQLADGTVYAVYTGNLPPGERGQHTNGPPTHYLRRPGTEWRAVPRYCEAMSRSRVSLWMLLRAADTTDTCAEFEALLWGDP